MSERDWYCEEVLSGRQTVHVVYETDCVVAFRHTRPAYEHHVVVIPKAHVPSFVDLGASSEADLAAVIRGVRQVATAMLDECRYRDAR